MDNGFDPNDHDSCCKANNNLGLCQSLLAMEFERGIWYAAQHNDLDRIRALMRKGISTDVTDSAGYTALHYAARNGHYEACELLLENDAPINAQTRCGHATALHRAATQGRENIVELLLKFGASTDLKDADGYTALQRAIAARSMSVCKLLIPRTNLTLLTTKDRTLEEYARENFPDILPFLLEHVEEKGKVVKD